MNVRNMTSTQTCRWEKKAKAKQKYPSDEFQKLCKMGERVLKIIRQCFRMKINMTF